jgi:PadR family transcriptional regulator, regulatory protein PadR
MATPKARVSRGEGVANVPPQKIPNDLPGPIEMFVMTAIITLGDNAHGIAIFDLLQERLTHKKISFGSVYTALERLTWKGYLEDRMGEPEATRGGRARKYYRTTAVGQAVLKSTTDGLAAVAQPIVAEAMPMRK